MNRHRFERRAFLAGLGLGAGLVPTLAPWRSFAAPVAPRRLVICAVPNGYTADGVPEAIDGGWRAKEVEFSPLKPLEPWKDRLLVMGGINVQNGIDTAREVKNDPKAGIGGHAILPFLLTGAKGVPGPAIPDGWNLTASHPSVDQYVVQNLPEAKARPFPSLVLRPVKLSANGYGTNPLSYAGKTVDGRSHNAPTVRDNPFTLFAELFGGRADPAELDRLRAQRRSILDFTTRQLTQLRDHAGTLDRQRLDDHLEGVSQLEKRLMTLAEACRAPGQPDATIWSESGSNPNLHLVMRAHIDMTVMAMACDLTRVSTHSWCQSNNNTIVFPWLADRIPSLNDTWAGSNNAGSGNNLRNHHTIAHNDTELRREKNLVDRFFLENYAYFIERLSKTLDADGRPMIENTLVLYANMQRTGGGHQVDNLIWFLAGNCQGYFKQGRHLPWVSGTQGKTAPTNGILTALVNAMGCPPVTSFGDPAYGGEWASLRA